MNLLAGTLTKYVLLAVTLGTGAFLLPFTLHHLGKQQYGLWMLVASITYYFALLDLGYGNGLVRHVVEADSRGDTHAVNRVVSTFVCVYSAIGLIAAAACALIALYLIPAFPNLSRADVRAAQIVLAVLGARVAIGFPMTVFGAIVNARQRFALNNAIAIVLVLANALVTYVVLEAGFGLIPLVAATAAVGASGYVGYAWSAWRVFPALDIRLRYFSRHDWRDVTSFSTYLFIAGLGSQISFNLDNLIVGAYLGTAAVAVYSVAARLSEYQRRVCDQFSGMLFPVVVGLDARGDRAALEAAIIDGTRISVLLVMGVTICLVGFAEPLIAYWMGNGFEASVPPLYVLAFVGVVMVSHAVPTSLLLAAGGHRTAAAVWIAEGAANLVLSLLLVRRFGALGVAVGTAIPLAVGHFGVMMPAACRRIGLPLARYAAATLRPALAGTVPAVLLCLALRAWVPPTSLSAVVVEASAVATAYFVAVLTAGLDQPTRRAYWHHLREAVRELLYRQPLGSSDGNSSIAQALTLDEGRRPQGR